MDNKMFNVNIKLLDENKILKEDIANLKGRIKLALEYIEVIDNKEFADIEEIRTIKKFLIKDDIYYE